MRSLYLGLYILFMLGLLLLPLLVWAQEKPPAQMSLEQCLNMNAVLGAAVTDLQKSRDSLELQRVQDRLIIEALRKQVPAKPEEKK